MGGYIYVYSEYGWLYVQYCLHTGVYVMKSQHKNKYNVYFVK